jgi:2-keto-4-pentenoate hydratase
VHVTEQHRREAAEIIGAARLDRRPLTALPESLRPADEGEGYLLQNEVRDYLAANGKGQRVGYKIGCTTKVMQEYLRIPNPCSGTIFEDTVQPTDGKLALADYVAVGVECEIAVRLGRDLPAGTAPFDREAAADAVGSCMASIEIVDNRYADFTTLGAPMLIADDFFGAGCVLGPEQRGFDPRRLTDSSATLSIDGVAISGGKGSDILGNPLDALAWLANNAVRYGEGLRAGQIVSLGSVVKTQWLDKPCEIKNANDLLGDVTVRLI